MFELLAGLIVALAALAAVLEPLARGSWVQATGPAGPDESDLVELRDSDSPKVQALIALREIEFDRATGKLSDDDYVALKAKYQAAALAAIQAEEQSPYRAPAVPPSGPGAAAPTRGSVCPTCGPRPEAAPIFCSGCGRSLVAQGREARCWHCGFGSLGCWTASDGVGRGRSNPRRSAIRTGLNPQSAVFTAGRAQLT